MSLFEPLVNAIVLSRVMYQYLQNNANVIGKAFKSKKNKPYKTEKNYQTLARKLKFNQTTSRCSKVKFIQIVSRCSSLSCFQKAFAKDLLSMQ